MMGPATVQSPLHTDCPASRPDWPMAQRLDCCFLSPETGAQTGYFACPSSIVTRHLSSTPVSPRRANHCCFGGHYPSIQHFDSANQHFQTAVAGERHQRDGVTMVPYSSQAATVPFSSDWETSVEPFCRPYGGVGTQHLPPRSRLPLPCLSGRLRV